MIKNYYIAKVAVSQCTADIRINDVPIFRKSVDGDLTTELPINHHIEFSGIQEFSVTIRPLYGNAAFLSGEKCEVEIWRYDGSESKIVPLEQMCAGSLIVGEAEVMLPFKQYNQVFAADVSCPISRWNDCIEIKDSRKVGPAVAAFFKKFGQTMADKQYSQYMEFVREREVKICRALLLGEEEVSKRNKMLFDFLNQGFVLQPLTGGKRLQLYAHNRVVTVLDKDYGPSLKFVNEDTDQALRIELLLGFKKGHVDLSVI